MTDSWYVAILEKNSEGLVFATIPDLPGVNASGNTRAEALALVTEFAADYVRDLVDDGHAVPDARDIDDIKVDPDVTEIGRALIPVDVPGRSMKISLSIDEALLKRVDRAAAKSGMSRSGFFAAAVEARARATSARTSAGSTALPSFLTATDATFLGRYDNLGGIATRDVLKQGVMCVAHAGVDAAAFQKAIRLGKVPVVIKGDTFLKAFADTSFIVPEPDDDDNPASDDY
jgi:predicted RNase H-like HicB family nuclease